MRRIQDDQLIAIDPCGSRDQPCARAGYASFLNLGNRQQAVSLALVRVHAMPRLDSGEGRTFVCLA